MLIYDVNKGEFVKLAKGWDWEAIGEAIKAPAIGGMAGAALGAILDLLYPSYKSKMLPLGLLGLAGGGIYNILGGYSASSPKDVVLDRYNSLSKFVKSVTVGRPRVIADLTPEDVEGIDYKNPSALYMSTVGSALAGDLSTLMTLQSLDRTTPIAGTTVGDLVDAIEKDTAFAYVVTLLPILKGSEYNVSGYLTKYLQAKANYLEALRQKAGIGAESPVGKSIQPEEYLAKAERFRKTIIETLSDPETLPYLTGDPRVGAYNLKTDMGALISKLKLVE